MTMPSEPAIKENAVIEFCERNGLDGIPKQAIAEFCRRNHIKRLAIFDADTRDMHDLDDNDMYVSFKHGHEQEPKSKKLHAMQDELREILGVEVRLKTRHELSNWLLVAFYPTELLYRDTR